jgi:hypothetical protein
MRGIVANGSIIGIGESRPFHPQDNFGAASWKIERTGTCAVKKVQYLKPGLSLRLKLCPSDDGTMPSAPTKPWSVSDATLRKRMVVEYYEEFAAQLDGYAAEGTPRQVRKRFFGGHPSLHLRPSIW